MIHLVLTQFLVFVYLNVCVAGIAFVVAWRLGSRPASLIDFAAAMATVFLALIVIVETVLGTLHLLTLPALVVIFSIGALISWFVLLRSGSLRAWPLPWHAQWARTRQAMTKGSILHLLIIALWSALALIVAALLEPSQFWDSFAYHLSWPADWLQHHGFTLAYLPLAEIANSYFPGNGELLYFWALAPFRNELLVRMVPVACWMLLGLGLWRLCRQCGASRRATAVATGVFLLSPLVLSESVELWTDGISASLFVLALGHLVAYSRQPSLRNATLFGLASGLFLGVKYSGPAYLVLLLAAFAAVVFGLRRTAAAAPVWRPVLVIAATTAATGAYWYLRNLLLDGNPVYPRAVSVLGQTIFAGPGSSQGDTLWQSAGVLRLQDVLAALLLGYGIAFWLAAGLAIVVVGRALYLKRGQHLRLSLDSAAIILIAGLMLASLLVYLNTPYSVMRYSRTKPIDANDLAAGMRFSLIAAACASVLIAAGLSRIQRSMLPGWILISVALAGAALTGFGRFAFFPFPIFTPSRLVGTGALAVAVAFGLSRLSRPGWSRRSSLRHLLRPLVWVPALLATLLGIGVGLSYLEQYRETFRYPVYQRTYGEVAEAWKWIDDNVNNARVAYVGESRILVAYGSDLNNEVRYVNIAGRLDERYDDFYRRGTGYRTNGTYETWKRNLQDWSAEYLVVAFPEKVIEDKWAAAHPDAFTPLAEIAWVRVYRITPAQATQRSSEPASLSGSPLQPPSR